MRSALLVSGLLVAVLLSGCSNDANGQSASGAGNLAYNGASNGSHSDSFDSDGSCELRLSANLGSGRVHVTMTAPGAATVDGSVEGPGQKDTAIGAASGPAGTWTLTAERTSNSMGTFSGQYLATAVC